MILAKEAGDGGMPMARTARAAFTKSSPVPVWLQYFEKSSSCPQIGMGKQNQKTISPRLGMGFGRVVVVIRTHFWAIPVISKGRELSAQDLRLEPY